MCVEGMKKCSICVISLECGQLSNVIYQNLHRKARNFMFPVVGALALFVMNNSTWPIKKSVCYSFVGHWGYTNKS